MTSLLLFFTFFVPISLYAMQPSIYWLKTSDKKIITMTNEEKCQSSYINIITINNMHRGSSKEKSVKIDIKKKDIQFFKKIIHQPSLYDNTEIFHQKKYLKALAVAEKLKAPFLYADLLMAQLPKNVTALITQHYIDLQNISERLRYEIFNSDRFAFNRQLAEIWKKIDTLTEHITLSQAMILSLIHNNDQETPIKIAAHMPGYKALFQWPQEQFVLILDLFIIETKIVKTKTDLDCIVAFQFNV